MRRFENRSALRMFLIFRADLCALLASFRRTSDEVCSFIRASGIHRYLHTSSAYTSDAALGVLPAKSRPTPASALPFPALHHSGLPTILGGPRNADIDYRNSYLTQRDIMLLYALRICFMRLIRSFSSCSAVS